MASQVLNLGASAFGGEGNWEGAILVDPALIEGGGTAYLRQLRLIGNDARLRLATSPDADPADAGPEFTAALETADAAFTLAQAGGASIVLKGPGHPDNTFADSTEVYYWTPDNAVAWHDWAIGVGSGVVTLTLDDGQTAPTQPISATFTGAAGSLSLALTRRSPLALADFETAGLEIDALALIEAGAPPSVFGIAPRPTSGALLDGELGLGPTNEPITRLWFQGGLIRLNDNGPLVQSDYWADEGPGYDLTLHVQTTREHIAFPIAGKRAATGGGYVSFNVPAEHQAFVGGIVEGERLIFALTRPAATSTFAIAATFAAPAATLAVTLAKRTPGTQPISAAFAGAAGSLSLALAKRSLAARPIAATFAARAATLAVALAKRTPGTQPISAAFAGAAGSLSLALTKRSPAARPIAATFAARAATLAVALVKPTDLPESARRRIHSSSGSWDGVRVGDLVAVGRATSYTRDLEVAAVRYDDRSVRLTLVDYPEALYAGELPLDDFESSGSIPGPYLGPACPVILGIQTGVDDVGQDRAGTNPILLRIEIAADDSDRPTARAYRVQCRQAQVAGRKPTPAEDDDPVLQGRPDTEYFEQPGSDWEDCGIVEKPGLGTLVLSSGFSIGERIDIRVIAVDDEGRASCWRIHEGYMVELPDGAEAQGQLHTGPIDPEQAPDDALGKDGDVFIAEDGRFWRKVDGAWVFQLDFTDAATKIHTGEVAPDGTPPVEIGKLGDLFFAFDGRWWEKTDEMTWTLRGDLTGLPGSATFTGADEPPVGLGKDGDIYVRDDGTVWKKVDGAWTQTGVDLTGEGDKLITGEVAEGASPSALLGKVGDVFIALDGRFWQKTDENTWTLRGDLTGPPGSATFTGSAEPPVGLGKDGDIYVRDDGTVWKKVDGAWTQTGVDLTGEGDKLITGEVAEGASPSALLGKVGDVFIALDGRFWQKTDADTWTLRGDLTGPPGSATFTGSAEPPVGLGKDGDIYVRDDGTVWKKVDGAWTQTGVDLTGEGDKLITGEVAEGQSPSALLGKVGDVFIALDGRFWEKTDETTWTLRGDLTGPPGTATYTGAAEPPVALGKDGDVYVRDDGTLWTKANGVWTYSGVDLTGPPGTKLIPGEVAEGASPSASLGNVGDIFFNLDGRVWEKTDDATWTSRGDITGPPGSSLIPGVVAPDALPPANVGRVGDTFLAADGRFWQKTDATTWTYIEDLTGPPGGGINPRGQWSSGIDYAVGDSVFRDFSRTINIGPLPGGGTYSRTFRSSRSYLCKLAHTSSSSNAPSGGGNTYWDAISGDTSLGGDETPDTTTTTPFIGYRLASSTPATPSSSTENPSGWSASQPPPHATQNIYKLEGTRTYDDSDVFQSAVWAVTYVRGPIVVTTTSVTRYRLASSTPATPGSSTENPPSGWTLLTNPDATTTQGVYKLVGTRTYHDDVFKSAAWAVTRVAAPVSPGTTVTTTAFTGYTRASSTPDTPSSSTENPSRTTWPATNPGPTTLLGVYKLMGTRTYHDDVFQSAEWAVTKVRGPIVVLNTFEYVYRLSVGAPPSPLGGTSTEDHIPANWSGTKPSPTSTQGVYQSDRSTRYEDDVFIRATAWRTPTLVPGQGPTGGLLLAPGSVSVSAIITMVKGTTIRTVSGVWNGVVGASGGYQYELENTTKETSTSGSVTAARSFSKTNFAISVGDTVRLRVRARGDVADMIVGPWSGWVSTTVA